MKRLFTPVLRRIAVTLALVVAASALWLHRMDARTDASRPTRLALVVPDGIADDDVDVLAWRDAAVELGVPMVTVSASQLVRDADAARNAALILPDRLHRRMNDALLANLTSRVERDGATLMVVHDAGVLDMGGHYADESRLSSLTGVRYALYERLRTAMLDDQNVWVEFAALPLLRLPPGKLVRDDDQPLTSANPPTGADTRFGVVGYRYGRMRYPVFATEGGFDGLRLMSGEHDSLLAGLHVAGRGRVLFVNLPLTYLKLRTDSLFMNRFMRYFAEDLAHLPLLSSMPEGRGALVMNWHIDSAAAVPAMEQLAARGGLGQGPYSIHLTAGPDVDLPGDGRGMDLATNDVMLRWVADFARRGDEIGSHGGWIHNEFGRLVGSQATERSATMIERNSEVVSAASGLPVREYSAPTGNHPSWITPWLRAHGFNAYYFTGDIGMPPTRSYQDGKRGPAGIWAFPVLSYGADAAFEEAHNRNVAEADIEAWLRDVADYCADNRTVRLVYFHPGGIAFFPLAFEHWLAHAATLRQNGRLRWMTMASYATFADRRVDVHWTLDPGTTGGRAVLDATHPASLKGMAWMLPADRFGRPVIRQGEAEISEDGASWRVVAAETSRLVLDVDDRGPPTIALTAATQSVARGSSP